jgi:branched-chain amino acid transport system permease protein
MFLSPDMFKFWESFCFVHGGPWGPGQHQRRAHRLGRAHLLGEIPAVCPARLGLPAETRFLVYGLIMVLIMRFRPGGFFTAVSESTMKSPLIMDLRRRLAARKTG